MELFDALTHGKTSTLHAWDGSGFRTSSWSDVVRDAERIAVGLRRAGVEPGTRVATILTNSPEAVRGLLGVWLAGGTVASLPVPARGMTFEDYVEQITTIRGRLESPLLVTEQRLVDAFGGEHDVGAPLASWESLPADGKLEAAPPAADDVAFIQYSSGSTSMPKGCMLTTRAIGRQLETIAEISEPTAGDTVVSWLPLSHDMGMFGCLLYPWVQDLELALSSPERFIANPRTWMGDCAEYGASMTAGPPSALRIASRAQRRPLEREIKLRVCVLGAERIDWDVVQDATATFAPSGLKPNVWMPAYGLAEATLVVSAVAAREVPARLVIDTVALAEGEIRLTDPGDERATSIVDVGEAPSGIEIRTADPDRLSEILIRSESMFSGYHGDPETTASKLSADGELDPGDLGFMRDGRLYVVGRADDLLSVGGRNVYARDIELAVDGLEGVRSGCSTIVDAGAGANGTGQRLVMLLELKDESADTRELAGAAARTATQKAGVPLDECVFLRKGTLPKTPSGKIQRFRCRQLVLAGELEPLARVEL